MTRNDHEQHGLEYYESKRESKDDRAKTISVQPESGVKDCDTQLPMKYLDLFGMSSIWRMMVL